MAEIRPIKVGKMYFRPIGDNVVGFMSSGDGMVEIGFEPIDEDQADVSVVTNYTSSVSFDLSFDVEDENLLDLLAGERTTMRHSMEITYTEGKPPRPHWKSNLFVWWYYLKDYIKWYKKGKPEYERKLMLPSVEVNRVNDNEIVISKEEYEYLLDRDELLTIFEDNGIENWEGFLRVIEEYNDRQ